MLRSLGTVLLIVPLLLPPGVCVCDLLAQECGACAEAAAPAVAPSETGCCCKHHRPAQAVCLHTGHTCSKSKPANAPDNHPLGCPAKPDHAQWKAQPGNPPTLVGPVPVHPLAVAEPLAAGARSLFPEQSGHPPDQPLYLTLLTLLI